MIEKLLFRIKNNFLVIFLISLFSIDLLNKFDFASILPWVIIIKVCKFIFYFYFLLSIWNIKNLKNVKWVIGIITIFFITNQISLHCHQPLKDTITNPFLDNIRLFILLLFPLIFSSYLSENLENYLNFKKIEYIYILLVLIASACVIIGLIGDIKFFKTYSTRFGYDGLMPKSITASYFFISSTLYFYFSYFIKNRTKFKWLLILVIFTSFIVGTKALYTFLFLLFTFHIISQKFFKNPIFYVISSVVLISIFVLRNKVYEILTKNFTPLVELYEKEGLLTSLLSIRDQIFRHNISIYKENWEWWNIFIGGRIPELKLFENSVLDLISFIGIIGIFLYLKIIYERLFAGKEANNYFINFSLILIFIISILAGQFFLNFSAISYVLLTLFMMKFSKNLSSQ